MGNKWSGEIESWYDQHIEAYRAKEDSAIQSLFSASASEAITKTNALLGGNDLEQAIRLIEQSINTLAAGLDSKSAGTKVAQKILEANTKLNNILDVETLSTLQQLADGSIGLNDLVLDDLENQTAIAPTEIGAWIQKILIGLREIEVVDKQTPTKLRGYVSNLKGAILEEGVLNLLADLIPKDAVVRTGNINVDGRGQIAEDILLLYPSGRIEPLLSMLQKAQEKRVTINVPTYELMQKSGAGVSVKAGGKTIKYFQGNITHFFDDSVSNEATAYKNYLLNRKAIREQNKTAQTKQKIDSYKDGNSLNRLLVAAKLDQAIGANNLFIAIRGKFFRTSAFLERKKSMVRAQLRMTDIAGTVDSVTGRIVGSGA